MTPPPSSSTLHSILDIYQACRARGEYAKVTLETRGGKEMVTFCSCEEGYPTPASRAGQPRKKKKSPSDIARSKKRREAWLARRADVPEMSTPAHCSRTRPYTVSSTRNQLTSSDIPQFDGELPTTAVQDLSRPCETSCCESAVTADAQSAQSEPEPLHSSSAVEEHPAPYYSPPPTPPAMTSNFPTHPYRVLCRYCFTHPHPLYHHHCGFCHTYGKGWHLKSS